MNFGVYLDDKRQQAGYSWAYLALQIGKSRQHMTDVHKGRRAVTDEVAEALAKTLSLDRDEVYWQAGKLPPDIESLVIEVGPEHWRQMRRSYYQADPS